MGVNPSLAETIILKRTPKARCIPGFWSLRWCSIFWVEHGGTVGNAPGTTICDRLWKNSSLTDRLMSPSVILKRVIIFHKCTPFMIHHFVIARSGATWQSSAGRANLVLSTCFPRIASYLTAMTNLFNVISSCLKWDDRLIANSYGHPTNKFEYGTINIRFF